MTFAVASVREPALAAPVESQFANPVESVATSAGVTIRASQSVVSATQLRAPNPVFRGRSVLDPRQQQAQQYLEDEQAGILRQTRRLVDSAPASATAWSRLAQALLSQGELDEAIAASRRVVELLERRSELDTDAEAAIYIAARAFAVAGDESTAEELLAKLPAPGPWTVLYAALADRRGEFGQGLARLEGDDSGEASAFRGYLYLQKREPHRALSELRRASRSGVVTPSLLLNLAYAFAVTGSPRKAVSYARQATHLAPDSRQASFNLASYLRSAGDPEAALSELQRLRSILGEGDAQVAAAIADALLACSNPRGALRELRRAQHHNVFSEGSIRYAELTANAALLEWRLGERDRDSLLALIRQQLQSVGSHLPLVLMLSDAVNRADVVPEVEKHYKLLAQRLNDLQLAPLRIRLLLMRGETEEAALLAKRHAEAFPLDGESVRGAIVLEGQVFGRYGEAAEIGLKALQRLPGDQMLANNVAFCLALAQRGQEALAILERFEDADPYIRATRGLALLSLGRIEQGLECYDAAVASARKMVARSEDADDFERLLRLQESLAVEQLGLASEVKPDTVLRRSLPEDWQADPRYLVLLAVSRRMHSEWPAKLSDSGGVTEK